jgi:hypothetical protein
MGYHLHSNGEKRNSLHRFYDLKRIMIVAILFSFLFSNFAEVKESKADANSEVNVKIDYLEEIAVITPGTGGSTKFYMSTDNMKTWEMIETTGVANTGGAVITTGFVDISTILTTKQVDIYFKGNKDQNPVMESLQGEVKNLSVSYKIVGGVGSIEFSPVQTVEFRKGAYGAWKTASNLMSTSIYELRGATLYFRTPATAIKRAGKIVSIKISKRPTAPSAKLDGSKLCISGLKLGETYYRVGDSTTWLPFTSPDPKAKSISLYTLLTNGTVSNSPIPAGVIEFRTLGTDKKLTSAVKVIEISAQPITPEAITLVGTTLTIQDSNTKKAYEYTRVEKNSTLNLNTAKWTSVTSKNSLVITKVAIGDKILVRAKSYTDSTSKKLILPSTYKELPVTSITIK